MPTGSSAGCLGCWQSGQRDQSLSLAVLSHPWLASGTSGCPQASTAAFHPHSDTGCTHIGKQATENKDRGCTGWETRYSRDIGCTGWETGYSRDRGCTGWETGYSRDRGCTGWETGYSRDRGCTGWETGYSRDRGCTGCDRLQ